LNDVAPLGGITDKLASKVQDMLNKQFKRNMMILSQQQRGTRSQLRNFLGKDAVPAESTSMPKFRQTSNVGEDHASKLASTSTKIRDLISRINSLRQK